MATAKDTHPATRLIRLAWPVLIAQVATIGMMAIDTVVMGHVGTDQLAALAVGASIYVSLALALSGVMQALLPGVAHRLGQGDPAAVAHLLRQAVWLGLALAVIGDAVLLFPGWLIDFAELPAPVAAIVQNYLHVLAFSLPASLGYRAFHAIAGGVGRTRPLMWLSLGQTTAHALLSPLLADSIGIAGVSIGLHLGATGAALSQAILGWLVCLTGLSVLALSPYYRGVFGGGLAALKPGRPDWRVLAHLLRVGVPMGLSYFVEITSFTLMSIFIARLGPEVLSGHRIIANLSALVYMLPLALGTATAALVGQAAGARRHDEAQAIVRSGFKIACAGGAVVSVLLWLGRGPLAALVSPDPAVQAVTVGLIAYVAAYQLFDAIQTIAGFALRGYHITLTPLLVHLTAFWLVGLGGGYWLAFVGWPGIALAPMGAAGFWCAALIATVVAAIGLFSLLRWVQAVRQCEAPGASS